MAIRSQFLNKLWTRTHSFALGFLLGVSLMTAAIWYGIPARAQTVNIPIQNPSFEQVTGSFPSANNCGKSGWEGQNGFHIPGWQWQASSGVFQLANPNPCNIAVPPPDGLNATYLDSSIILQDTGIKASDIQAHAGPTRSGRYTLTVYTGDYYPPYPGYFTAELGLGHTDAQGIVHIDHELCSLDGPVLSQWEEITLPCLSPGHIIFDKWSDGSAVDLNAHLIVSLSATWWETLADNVSLTFTPTN